MTLYNGSGHRLPTAEPQRRVEVVLEALDRAGVALRESSENLQRVILLPKLVETSDTTLLPREERTIQLKVATDGAQSLRVRVVFHLWDPDHRVARAASMRPGDLVIPVFSETSALN